MIAVGAFTVGLVGGQHAFGDVGCGLTAAWGERGPVVEVNDTYGAVLVNDTVAAIDLDVHDIGRAVAHVAQGCFIKLQIMRRTVDSLCTILAVMGLEGIEPVEKRLTGHTVKFDKVARQVAVDDRTGYTAVEVFMQHLLRLLRMTHEGDILLVHGVEIAALDPALLHTGIDESLAHVFVGIDYQRVGIRYAGTQKDTGHLLADAVFDTETGVDDEYTLLLKMLETGYGILFATHSENDVVMYVGLAELLLAVYFDFAAPLTELVGNGMEDGGIIAYMVWGVCAGTQDTGYFDAWHLFLGFRY